jgi:membrane protease YdiL (CAAX protease family)
MPQIETQTENRFNPGWSGVLASGRLFRTRALLWAALLWAGALGFFFASVFGAGWMGLRGNWFYVPPIVIPLLACWLYALLVGWFERREPWEIQIGAPMLSELPIGFLFGGAFIAAMWLILLSLKLYQAHRGVWTGWFGDLVFDSYISAVLEELAFRAVMLRIFSRVWGTRAGVVLSSILFGLAHFSHGSWLGILGIIVNAGLAIGLLYVISGRLWLSIGAHLGFDFIESSVLGIGSHHGLLVNTPKAGAAAWLTGGTFGPDAAIPAMIFGVLVNVLLWRLAFGKEVTSEPALQAQAGSAD